MEKLQTNLLMSSTSSACSASSAAPTDLECAICWDTAIKPLICPKCEKPLCDGCARDYLLQADRPDCSTPGCDWEWTYAIILKHLPKTFVNGPLRKHEKELMWAREKAKHPSLIPEAEAIRTATKRKAELNRELRALRNEYADKRIIQARQLQSEYLPRIDAMEQELRELRGAKPKVERKLFIWPCPVNKCPGFLSQQWKCGLCDNYSCKDCHNSIGPDKKAGLEEHTCNEDDVESVKLKKQDCQSCPKCSIPIYRVSGCADMFCTMCHTSFNWRTGKISTTRRHNPHYFAWLHDNGGVEPTAAAPAAEPICQEGLPSESRLMNHWGHWCGREDRTGIHEVYTLLLEIEQEYRGNYVDKPTRDISMSFLLGDIDQRTWEHRIFLASRQNQKKAVIRDILDMFTAVATDKLREFAQTDLDFGAKERREIINELVRLRKYTNVCFKENVQALGFRAHPRIERGRSRTRSNSYMWRFL